MMNGPVGPRGHIGPKSHAFENSQSLKYLDQEDLELKIERFERWTWVGKDDSNYDPSLEEFLDLNHVKAEYLDFRNMLEFELSLEAVEARGSSFRFSNMEGLNLSGMDLRGSDITGVKLARATLAGAELYQAKGDFLVIGIGNQKGRQGTLYFFHNSLEIRVQTEAGMDIPISEYEIIHSEELAGFVRKHAEINGWGKHQAPELGDAVPW